MYKRFFKQENGAITLFVLLAMLFFIIIIFSIFMISSNKKQSQTSEIDKIKERYGDSVNNIDQLYNEALTENLSSLLKVGDYVNYTYDTVADGYNLLATESGYANNQTISQTSGLKWRILNIHEDGTIDLIADMSSSSQEVTFKGALGYNNGVYLLNDICKKLYSNSHLGITARSINLEDIENQMNDEGIMARNTYNNGVLTYGKAKTYTGDNTNYPNLYAQENGSGINTEETKKDGISSSENGYTSPTTQTSTKANSLTVTQSYYSVNNIAYFDNSEVYDILFNTGFHYWLASRYANCFSINVAFGLRSTSGPFLVFDSNGGVIGNAFYHIRPVVSLDSDIQITIVKNPDGSSIENMHQIKGIYE